MQIEQNTLILCPSTVTRKNPFDNNRIFILTTVIDFTNHMQKAVSYCKTSRDLLIDNNGQEVNRTQFLIHVCK